MIQEKKLDEKISEGSCERASNVYLMSLVVIIAGMPLPILNLLATFFFYVAHRKGSYFVRWHCSQALLSQVVVFLINTTGFWWTIFIILGEKEISNAYVSYIIVLLFFNISEFIITLYTAAKVRKGKHISWWFYGDITDLIIKKNGNDY